MANELVGAECIEAAVDRLPQQPGSPVIYTGRVYRSSR